MSTVTADNAMEQLVVADRFRFGTQLTTRPLPFKEWQHFVVQTAEVRVVVNFSLSLDDQPGAPRRLAPRLVVLCHGATTASAHQRVPIHEVALRPDLCGLRLGASTLELDADGYRLSVDLPEHALQATIVLRPRSRPFVVNNQPVGAGRLSWLFVPDLVADGELCADGRSFTIDAAPAYHDHNWGHFRWGDDFSWMWGSVLPDTPDGLSLVVMRMTDRSGQRAHAQAIYAWKQGEPIAIARDRQVRIRREHSFAAPAIGHLPPIVGLLANASSDVPERLHLSARSDDGHLDLTFTPTSFTRIGLPDELTTNRIVTLDEATGDVVIDSTFAAGDRSRHGVGFFEFCHG